MLMVDDHPFILQAYKNTLDLFKPTEYEMIYYDGIDGKTGYEVITNATTEYDIALFDISMPSNQKKIFHLVSIWPFYLRKQCPIAKSFY